MNSWKRTLGIHNFCMILKLVKINHLLFNINVNGVSSLTALLWLIFIQTNRFYTTLKRSWNILAGMEAASRAPAQQRLSPIPELDRWERETDASSPGFGYSWALDKYSTSSTSSLSESQERGGEYHQILQRESF